MSERTSAMNMETMFFCIPLRTGVFFCSLLTLLFSIIVLADYDGMHQYTRPWMGGFGMYSKSVLGFVECTGLIAGICGLIGTWYSMASQVKVYNLWQVLRLAAWVYIYIEDVPLLNNCEMWVAEIDTMIKEHGWNHIMYNIAMDGQCEETRSRFFTCSIIALTVFIYLVWATARHTEQMEKVPKHLLRLPKDAAAGAYFAHSLGERSMLKQGGLDEHVNLWNAAEPQMAGPNVNQPGYGYGGVVGQP